MGILKSSKFVFDLRNLQKQDVARFIRKKLQIVKDGRGDSAVFLIRQDVDISSLELESRPEFSLVHVEQIAIPQHDPYQIVRFENFLGIDLKNNP